MGMQKIIKIGNYKISNTLPLAFMAGTCVIESETHYIDTAKKLKAIIAKTDRTISGKNQSAISGPDGSVY